MSPVATRSKEDAGVAVLEAADRLFYERGVAGVGMDDVRDAAGVSLRRLYMLYPSKRDLVAAWLRDRHERWMNWFCTSVDASVAAGADPLVATFDAIEHWAASPSYRGCAFLNVVAETTEIDDEHRLIAADHKRDLVAYLATLAAGSHPDAPAWVPGALGVLIDGAIVQAAVFDSVEPVRVARCAAAQLVGVGS